MHCTYNFIVIVACNKANRLHEEHVNYSEILSRACECLIYNDFLELLSGVQAYQTQCSLLLMKFKLPLCNPEMRVIGSLPTYVHNLTQINIMPYLGYKGETKEYNSYKRIYFSVS